ncbi:MAG: GerMN domain-containing protein [Roseburia sp.]|nr:GerMN domain-containing protein [Roseburia sp.]
MKKKLFFLLTFFLVLCTAGCSRENEIEGYHIEYLNSSKDAIVKVPYEPVSSDLKGMIEEFLIVLWSDSDNVNYRKPIPNDVELINYSLDGAMLTIWLDVDYYKMNQVEKVLCCASIVRTMTQLDGVDCISFYVGDSQLVDAQGNLVGALYADSFVENPGATINSISETNLTLYFSNGRGSALIAENRDVHYSSNMSIEKVIIEQLLDGPDTEGLKSAIPSGTKLVSVSTVEGTCYVNLDANFRNQDYTVMEPIVIYSIVNSLSEMSTINQVQISINGDNSGVYRDSYKLSDAYVRDLDYVTTLEAEKQESSESTENTETTESIDSTEDMTEEEDTEYLEPEVL